MFWSVPWYYGVHLKAVLVRWDLPTEHTEPSLSRHKSIVMQLVRYLLVSVGFIRAVTLWTHQLCCGVVILHRMWYRQTDTREISRWVFCKIILDTTPMSLPTQTARMQQYTAKPRGFPISHCDTPHSWCCFWPFSSPSTLSSPASLIHSRTRFNNAAPAQPEIPSKHFGLGLGEFILFFIYLFI